MNDCLCILFHDIFRNRLTLVFWTVNWGLVTSYDEIDLGKHWLYSTVRKYSKPPYELPEETHVTPFRTYTFNSTGLCNYKPEGCHVGYSREFVGTVYLRTILRIAFHNWFINQEKSLVITFEIWIWIRSHDCGCLVAWFCFQLIARPGNKTVAVSWPDPYIHHYAQMYFPGFTWWYGYCKTFIHFNQ